MRVANTNLVEELVEKSHADLKIKGQFRIINLSEAADFLSMNPETLRQKVKTGSIPGAKVGKRWIFVDKDLVQYVRSQYASQRQAVRVTDKEVNICHSTAVVKHGGSTSRRRMGDEYADLLGLTIVKKPSNTMIS